MEHLKALNSSVQRLTAVTLAALKRSDPDSQESLRYTLEALNQQVTWAIETASKL